MRFLTQNLLGILLDHHDSHMHPAGCIRSLEALQRLPQDTRERIERKAFEAEIVRSNAVQSACMKVARAAAIHLHRLDALQADDLVQNSKSASTDEHRLSEIARKLDF